MRLVNYTHNNAERSGLLFQDWLVDLEAAGRYLSHRSGDPAFNALGRQWAPDWYLRAEVSSRLLAQRVLDELNASLPGARAALVKQGVLLPVSEVEFLPSVRHPGKIVCVGLNYPEIGPLSFPVLLTYPVLFLKPASALTAHRQPIILPRSSRDVRVEAELAAVIGRIGKHIPPQRAWSHIAGFTIANDVGDKEIEKRTSQWTSGKISDTFCPLGPALVTTDEVPDPQNLDIQAAVNGEIVLEGNTSQMFYDIPTLISYISSLATLEPGDLILTGSPKGIVGLLSRGGPLKPGDAVLIEIEGIGALLNPVIAEEG